MFAAKMARRAATSDRPGQKLAVDESSFTPPGQAGSRAGFDFSRLSLHQTRPADRSEVERPLDPSTLGEPVPPEPTRPGDPDQQEGAFSGIHPAALWYSRVHAAMTLLAGDTEERERSTVRAGGTVKHTARNMMGYWHRRFVDSVDYILFRRGGDRRAKLLARLRAEEAKLIKAGPADLVDQVEALRRTHRATWQAQVEEAGDQFVTIANNEAQFLTVKQAAASVTVYGLPGWMEGTVDAASNKETVAKDSTPVAPSVVTFMAAVQKESKIKAKADNYADHEKYSPYVGDVNEVGKYSFDVHLDGLIKVNTEGFYEQAPLIDFFLAVERASTATAIEWIALYNDFEVARKVNEKIGKHRIGFSGAGSAGPGREGSIHHGPAPYILHIHFNVMPKLLSTAYIIGKKIAPYIRLGP
jgi:hypothetical protein